MKERNAKRLAIVSLLGSCLIVLSVLSLSNAQVTNYPTKAIDFIIPYGAGGGTDLVCRALIEAARKHLGQPIVPINKVGGGGSVGTVAIMNAKPDGYTIGAAMAAAAFIHPYLDGNPYKDLSGFTYILNFAKYVQFALVRGDSPWKTWKEFIEWARKNPGVAKIGILGNKKTSSQGMLLTQIEPLEKVKFTYIPFKGSTVETLSSLLGDHITMYLSSTDASVQSLLEEGKIRLLLYMSEHKLTGFEGAPTTIELYNLECTNMFGVCGPRGMPEHVVNRLEDVFSRAIKDPDFTKFMKMMNMPISYMNRVEFNKYIQTKFRETGELVKKLD